MPRRHFRHNFGNEVQLIDSIKVIRKKLVMIECLRASVLKSESIETNLTLVSKQSEKFNLIEQYFKNGANLMKAFDFEAELQRAKFLI